MPSAKVNGAIDRGDAMSQVPNGDGASFTSMGRRPEYTTIPAFGLIWLDVEVI